MYLAEDKERQVEEQQEENLGRPSYSEYFGLNLFLSFPW